MALHQCCTIKASSAPNVPPLPRKLKGQRTPQRVELFERGFKCGARIQALRRDTLRVDLGTQEIDSPKLNRIRLKCTWYGPLASPNTLVGPNLCTNTLDGATDLPK